MVSRQLLKIMCITLILMPLFSTAAFAVPNKSKITDSLVFSILPFLSPVALMKRFIPLQQYLESTTGRTIELESAPNFPEYLRRTVGHKYDIVYTAPHFVPLTLKDDHYQLLAASNKIAAHVIVSNLSKIDKVTQLAGKRIAHGPNQAFLVIIGKYLLKSKGLVGKNAPIFIQHKSHNAALRAVSGQEADAAIVGTFLLKKAAESNLKGIVATPFYPGIAILASKELPELFRKTLAKSFLSIKETKAGRETLKKIRFPGFTPATAADYESLIPIAQEVLDTDTFDFIYH